MHLSGMMVLIKRTAVPRLERIWYSTEDRMNSIWNASEIEDTGEIKFYKRRLKYSGQKIL